MEKIQSSLSLCKTLKIEATVVGIDLVFTASPSLLAGLSISPSTGTIAGSNTTYLQNQQFTVTATNARGSTSSSITITFVPSAPSGLAYNSMNVNVQWKGTVSISPLSVSGGPLSTLKYAAKELPLGLSINPNTGVITGTAIDAPVSAMYVIMGMNEAGRTATSINFQVTTQCPCSLNYNNTLSYYPTAKYVRFVPTYTGGPPETLKFQIRSTDGVTGFFVPGMRFNSDNGYIEGTPIGTIPRKYWQVVAKSTAVNTAECASYFNFYFDVS